MDAPDWQDPSSVAERDREFGLRTGVPSGAMVAQLISVKGHWVLIDALAILKRRGIAPNVVFFGRGRLERNVMALAEAAGVTEQVRFAGSGTICTGGSGASTSVSIRRFAKLWAWRCCRPARPGFRWSAHA